MMAFEYPPGLLLLLLIPLLLLFARRRSVPRLKILTAFFLLKDMRHPAPTKAVRFFRLKRRHRQTLVALIIAALALAISGASLTYWKGVPERWVVVVDNLPLGAREFEGMSVLEETKRFIIEASRSFDGDDTVTILTTSPRPTARTFAPGENLEDYASTLAVAEAFPGVQEAARPVEDLARHATATVVLSPRARTWREWARFRKGRGKVVIPPDRFSAEGNAGITTLRVRPAGGTGLYDIFFEAAASAGFPGEAALSAQNNGTDLAVPATVPLRDGKGQIFAAGLALSPGEVTFSLDVTDAFPLDDSFTVTLRGPEQVRIFLAGDSTPVFKAALESYALFTSTAAEEAEVDVFLGDPPGELAKPSLIIYPSRDRFGLTPEELVETTKEVVWHPDHPVTASLASGGVRPRRLMRFAFDGDFESLGSVEGTAAVLAGERNGRRVVVWTFNPLENELFLAPEFVILLRESVEWLAGKGAEPAGLVPAHALTAEARHVSLPDAKEEVFVRRDPEPQSLDLVPLSLLVVLLAGLYLSLSDALTEEESS